MKAMDVANFFIDLYKDSEEGVTNLKLQKLLYYSQGIAYQRFGTPLFQDEIEAWEDGPAIYDVWRKYTPYGRNAIRDSEIVDCSDVEERLLLDVAREYGKYTSSELVSQTHREGTPWMECYTGENRKVIPKETIQKYFNEVEPRVEEFDITKHINLNEAIPVTKDTVIPLSEWDG